MMANEKCVKETTIDLDSIKKGIGRIPLKICKKMRILDVIDIVQSELKKHELDTSNKQVLILNQKGVILSPKFRLCFMLNAQLPLCAKLSGDPPPDASSPARDSQNDTPDSSSDSSFDVGSPGRGLKYLSVKLTRNPIRSVDMSANNHEYSSVKGNASTLPTRDYSNRNFDIFDDDYSYRRFQEQQSQAVLKLNVKLRRKYSGNENQLNDLLSTQGHNSQSRDYPDSSSSQTTSSRFILRHVSDDNLARTDSETDNRLHSQPQSAEGPRERSEDLKKNVKISLKDYRQKHTEHRIPIIVSDEKHERESKCAIAVDATGGPPLKKFKIDLGDQRCFNSSDSKIENSQEISKGYSASCITDFSGGDLIQEGKVQTLNSHGLNNNVEGCSTLRKQVGTLSKSGHNFKSTNKVDDKSSKLREADLRTRSSHTSKQRKFVDMFEDAPPRESDVLVDKGRAEDVEFEEGELVEEGERLVNGPHSPSRAKRRELRENPSYEIEEGEIEEQDEEDDVVLEFIKSPKGVTNSQISLFVKGLVQEARRNETNLTFDQVFEKLQSTFQQNFRPKKCWIRSQFLILQHSKSSARLQESSEVVATIGKYTLTKHDLDTLNEDSWLNDKVISAYLELVAKTSPLKVLVMSSFLYQVMVREGFEKVASWHKDSNIFRKDLLLFPIHAQDHWSLIVVEVKEHLIKYFDSLSTVGGRRLKVIQKYLDKEGMANGLPKVDWTMLNCKKCPMQQNGSDCGVYVCQYAKKICFQKKVDFSHLEVRTFRVKMRRELEHTKLDVRR